MDGGQSLEDLSCSQSEVVGGTTANEDHLLNLVFGDVEDGAALSEYPLGTRPAKWTFPQRNRILAGLSRGVIVVQAPERSGSLITARLALE